MAFALRLPVLLAACAVLGAFAQQSSPQPTCVSKGLRCAEGSEQTMDCCSSENYECRAIFGYDGMFCLPRYDICYATDSMCSGEQNGAMLNEDKPCCDSELAECRVPTANPWASPDVGEDEEPSTSKFCIKKCYEAKERCAGAEGYDWVEYKPCCDESQVCREDPNGLWGRFCLDPEESPTPSE